MIIVEGPDGSGKTTLIDRLGFQRKHLKALRAGVGSEGSGNWGAGRPAIEAYANQLLTEPSTTAFDRFYLSETIYGPILRGQSAIRSTEVTVLQRLITALHVTEVICKPAFITSFSNVCREGRERPAYQTDAFLRDSYAGFDRASANPRYVVWNYEYDPLPSIDPSLSYTPDSIGDPKARVLIIGKGLSTEMPWPLFSMEGTAGFINTNLWYSRVNERDLAFTNPADSAMALSRRNPVAVLTLDEESHEECRRLNMMGRLYGNLTDASGERILEILRSVRHLLHG